MANGKKPQMDGSVKVSVKDPFTRHKQTDSRIVEKTPILDKMRTNRIFSIEVNPDKKTATLWEECDEYFNTEVTRDDLIKLCAEILTITSNMEN